MKNNFSIRICITSIFFVCITVISTHGLMEYIHYVPGKGCVTDSGKQYIPFGPNTQHAGFLGQADKITGLEYTDYMAWCAMLKSNGIHDIHIRLDPIYNQNLIGFNAIPAGTFYISYDNPIDAYWNGSQWVYTNYHPEVFVDGSETNWNELYEESTFTHLLRAAESNDIRMRITFWASEPTYDPDMWAHNPFNKACRYQYDIIPTPEEYKGLLYTGRFFCLDYTSPPSTMTTNEALWVFAQQTNTIAFFMKHWGNSPAIWCWEIMNEVQYMHANSIENTHDHLLPWVSNMAAYIREQDIHDRPVMVSGVRLYDGDVPDHPPPWGESDTRPWGEVNYSWVSEIFNYVDFVNIHNYSFYTLKDRMRITRRLQDLWPGKPVIVGEYLPCNGDNALSTNIEGPTIESSFYEYIGSYPYVRELPPFRNTRGYVCLQFVLTGGCGAAYRWTGFGFEDWTLGSELNLHNRYALPHTYQPYQSLTGIAAHVQWDRWTNAVPWEEYIYIDNNYENYGLVNSQSFSVAAQGDGDQVLLFFRSLQDEPTSVSVSNLTIGTYKIALFDWINGNCISTQNCIVGSDGVLNCDIDVTWNTEGNNAFVALTSAWDHLLIPRVGSNWYEKTLPRPAEPEHVDNRYYRNIGLVSIELYAVPEPALYMILLMISTCALKKYF